jgi:hypothetical protein
MVIASFAKPYAGVAACILSDFPARGEEKQGIPLD